MKNPLERPMMIAFGKNFPESILAVTTVLYGLMLIVLPESMRFAEYGVITGFLTTWAWGIAVLSVGAVNFWGILKRQGTVVRVTAKLLFFMWFFTAFMFGVAVPMSPIWILLLGYAILYGGVSSEYRTKSKWVSAADEPGPDL